MASLLLSPFAKADNKIILENVFDGDNLTLKIEQVGANNTINCYQINSCDVDGNNVSLHFEQTNESSNENKIQIWHLDGNSNQIRWGQGVSLNSATDTGFLYDSSDSGGHYARMDIHGDSNSIVGFQQNGGGSNSGHTFTTLIWSDNNEIWARQQGDGAKSLHIQTYNDGNEIEVRQKGDGANHSANIVLSGTYPTDLYLFQRSGVTQSYSLTQNCQTVGGCGISITQGD